MTIDVRLLRFTADPDALAALAARYCRADTTADDIMEKNDLRVLKAILKKGHFSVLEHVAFTFEIRGISRACSHQLVRHRIASFSQQSQRSIRLHPDAYVTPPSLLEQGRESARTAYERAVAAAFETYEMLLSTGVKKEDARFILPQGTTTALIMTMNARELRHFLRLRLAPDAQWEIRALAVKIKEHVEAIAPGIFQDPKVSDED